MNSAYCINERASTTLGLTLSHLVSFSGHQGNKIVPQHLVPTSLLRHNQRRINVDRVSIRLRLTNGETTVRETLEYPGLSANADSFLRKGLCEEKDTTELAQNGVLPSVTAVGVAFCLDALALATKAIRTMAAGVLASAKNGWIMMFSQIGVRPVVWRKVCKLIALITMETTSLETVAGQLRKYKTTTVELSNGSSLTACDLRSETGPNASELQRVVYGTGSNIGPLKKHSPCRDNRGRKCNRCFRYLDCFVMLMRDSAWDVPVGLLSTGCMVTAPIRGCGLNGSGQRAIAEARLSGGESDRHCKAVYLSSQFDRKTDCFGACVATNKAIPPQPVAESRDMRLVPEVAHVSKQFV